MRLMGRDRNVKSARKIVMNIEIVESIARVERAQHVSQGKEADYPPTGRWGFMYVEVRLSTLL